KAAYLLRFYQFQVLPHLYRKPLLIIAPRAFQKFFQVWNIHGHGPATSLSAVFFQGGLYFLLVDGLHEAIYAVQINCIQGILVIRRVEYDGAADLQFIKDLEEKPVTKLNVEENEFWMLILLNPRQRLLYRKQLPAHLHLRLF